MKKFTLLFVATLFSALSFAALNPYAYALSSTLNADQTELTVNYSLNATATNVDFVLLDGDKVIKTVNLNDKGLDKGSYTATVALDDPNMPLGKKLTWKLEVKGNSVDKPTKEETTYDLYCPHGLAIDKNPESEHFGRILVTESMQAVASKSADAYVSGGKGAGIYVFNPDFTTDKTRYSGGIDFTRKLASNGYQPYQVEISEDGRIFVSSCDINGVAVWEVSKDLNTWTPVISGTNDATDYTIKKNGNFFAGLNVAMDVKGSGDDLTLLLYSTNNKGIAYNQSGYRLDEYKLGTATTFTGTPKNIINGGAFGVVHTDVDFIYDGEGGYWFGGSRGGNAGQPNLVHINANGVEDYRNETNTHYGGGGVLVHNGMLIKGKLRTSSTDGNFGIYTIGKDANGKTTLTEKWAVKSPGLGRNHNAFAVDYAENLYVVGNNGEKMLAYALPYSGTVATPCASKYSFTINSAAQAAKASELNPYAYDLSSELSSDKKTLTIHYALNANAKAVSAVIMNGETEVKSFTCTGITRGEHSVAIQTAELPVGLKLTWQIKVDGTSKSVPTKVSTQYSLWGPYGLDIDKNPESEYFGRILATESYHGAKDLSGYLSTGQGGGLYVFTPDFATDGKVRNGEVNFTRKLASKGFQPFRVRISEDGRIFVTSLDINGVAVWEVSKDLQTWTPLLAGTNNSSDYRIYYNTSTFLAAPNASIDVTGTGDNLKLLLYSASKDAISAANQKWFRLDEYAMNGVETGETFPTSNTHKAIKAFNGYNLTAGSSTTYKYGVAYNQSAVIYDGEGGYWFAGSRGNNVATEPNLAHVNASGVQDYYNTSDQMLGGAGILIHNHSTKGKVLIKGTKPAGTFKVYALGKNADGTPKLDVIWTVTSGLGTNHNAFAMDYAENLYVVGNNKEKIFAFALPYSGSVTTPCAAKYAFELEARGVVKRAIQLGESTIVLTHEADGTPYLYNVVGDVMTPISQNGVIARDPENAGDYLSISDIAVTEDGKLVACNYVRCQFVEGNVESGYKRGILTFYIWNDLASDPAIWFQSKASSNSVNSDQGYTMAVAGTSSNADILVTGVHNTQRGVRMSHFSVIDGVYQDTENGQPNLPYYYFLGKKFKNTSAGVDAAVYREDAHGANFQLSVSPLAKENWIMDAELMEPSEFTNPQTSGVDPVVNSNLTEGTLGKKYTGATYVTVNDLHFMVAPYADASGKVAGVKVLDINNGLAAAKVMQTLDLATPVAGTAAATAVKVDGYDLAITLVVDAAIYTFETSIELEVAVDEEADNTTALAPYVGKRVDKVTVKRNFESNKCYTLTLPFDMNASQIEDVFGNATVYEFYNIYEQNAEELYLEFIPTSSIQAGKPCLLVTPAGSFDANDGFEVEDVIISTTPQPVKVDAVTMMPVLDNGYLMDDPSEYYIWNGGLYCAGTYDMTSKGLRAYFTSSSPLPVRARVVLKDNEATSIPLVGVETGTQVRKIMKDGRLIIIRGEEQYTIQGQRLD